MEASLCCSNAVMASMALRPTEKEVIYLLVSSVEKATKSLLIHYNTVRVIYTQALIREATEAIAPPP